MQLSVVIPVYNGSSHLRELVSRLAVFLPSIATQFEVVFVNDGSVDRSWETISRCAAESAWIRGIDLDRNYGQHNALLAGIRAAQYDVIVTMDDDLQHPPEEIQTLVDKLGQGYDLVYGIPRTHQRELWRIAASHLMRLILFGLGAYGAARGSSFRAFRKSLREVFAQDQSPFVAIDLLLARAKPKIGTVIIEHAPRRSGSSTYTLGRLITLALTFITSNTLRPLQVALVVGFGAIPLGFGLLVAGLEPAPTRQFFWGGLGALAVIEGTAIWMIGVYFRRVSQTREGRSAYIIREMTAQELKRG